MKYTKTLLIGFLSIILPFTILKVSIEYDVLIDFAAIILYLIPIYLPVLFAWLGIKIFKATNEIFFPILLFAAVSFFVIYCLVQRIFNSIERSLADAVIGLLLMGPLIYSVPASFIAAAIYKHKRKNQKFKNNEDSTTNEA